ncbi:hypothetical protein RRG08_055914 [Elysia crispata]|uniref:Uncharacterized protein n=1 Tax=Elysia crispata TaxID=231223 RepID=A0AAE0Y421_9GAST|nr:hypothetical protein RRG08_055914 [Elysia crispata]
MKGVEGPGVMLMNGSHYLSSRLEPCTLFAEVLDLNRRICHVQQIWETCDQLSAVGDNDVDITAVRGQWLLLQSNAATGQSEVTVTIAFVFLPDWPQCPES